MNRTLFVAAVGAATVALVVPLIATADHRPGHKPGGTTNPNPNLSIGAQPDTVLWGRATTISGKLNGQDNASKTIELQQNPHPFDQGNFKAVSTTTTDANGDYTFSGIRR